MLYKKQNQKYFSYLQNILADKFVFQELFFCFQSYICILKQWIFVTQYIQFYQLDFQVLMREKKKKCSQMRITKYEISNWKWKTSIVSYRIA